MGQTPRTASFMDEAFGAASNKLELFFQNNLPQASKLMDIEMVLLESINWDHLTSDIDQIITIEK